MFVETKPAPEIRDGPVLDFLERTRDGAVPIQHPVLTVARDHIEGVDLGTVEVVREVVEVPGRRGDYLDVLGGRSPRVHPGDGGPARRVATHAARRVHGHDGRCGRGPRSLGGDLREACLPRRDVARQDLTRLDTRSEPRIEQHNPELGVRRGAGWGGRGQRGGSRRHRQRARPVTGHAAADEACCDQLDQECGEYPKECDSSRDRPDRFRYCGARVGGARCTLPRHPGSRQPVHREAAAPRAVLRRSVCGFHRVPQSAMMFLQDVSFS